MLRQNLSINAHCKYRQAPTIIDVTANKASSNGTHYKRNGRCFVSRKKPYCHPVFIHVYDNHRKLEKNTSGALRAPVISELLMNRPANIVIPPKPTPSVKF